MSQRTEAADSPDDFPTPPWATRALMEYVLGGKSATGHLTCLEPACGAGHMSKVLGDYFSEVTNSDIEYYGVGYVRDFLSHPYQLNQFDWVITF